MKGILWHVARNLEGIFDGILMEFYMRISEDKNQIQKSMYIPWYLSSSLYGTCVLFVATTIRVSENSVSVYYFYYYILKLYLRGEVCPRTNHSDLGRGH